ncbi:hypothetical protein SLS62_009579 [Diatrype stigma]|uniref:Uncharacterized protein n=1 Tax=Diatrype stigma TaxID=117547 RepID=A0AAN9UKV4_9PEZI
MRSSFTSPSSSSGCWESGGVDGARLLRRPFSFSVRYRHQGGKDEDSSKQPPAPPSPPPSSSSSPLKQKIRKVLPTIPLPSLTPHENIYTIPNLLTFSRLAVAPFIGYAIVHDAHAWAMGMFVYAGVSDLLDGWIARHWKLQTVVGSVVDPMADKILMTVLAVSLAAQGSLPADANFTARTQKVWLAVIILGRDVGLAIAAIYYRWISLPPPKTMVRYWDFSLPSAEVRPTTISKYNTFLQLGLMGATMLNPLVAVDACTALTALHKDAVKILSENKKK